MESAAAWQSGSMAANQPSGNPSSGGSPSSSGRSPRSSTPPGARPGTAPGPAGAGGQKRGRNRGSADRTVQTFRSPTALIVWVVWLLFAAANWVDLAVQGRDHTSAIAAALLLLATGFARTRDAASTYPSSVFHGHLVCVLNQNSASDGDIFPAMFKQAKLGPLIGKRSWGGVVGITNRGPLVDGGVVNVPEFGFASADGRWIIEGYGVDPDIEVENDPKSVIDGHDPQLERAVEELMKKVREQPRRLPDRPAAPVKTP